MVGAASIKPILCFKETQVDKHKYARGAASFVISIRTQSVVVMKRD